MRNILIYCSNGYVLEEVFVPIIRELEKDSRITILIADFHISETSNKYIKELKELSNVEYVKIIQPDKGVETSKQYHERLIKLAGSFMYDNFDMIILPTDFQLFDKYLIKKLKNKNNMIVVLQTGTIIHVLKKYRELIGLDSKASFMRLLKDFIKGIPSRIDMFINCIVYPYILNRIFLPISFLDDTRFCSANADVVICYDITEYKALSLILPKRIQILLARHPAEAFKRG